MEGIKSHTARILEAQEAGYIAMRDGSDDPAVKSLAEKRLLEIAADMEKAGIAPRLFCFPYTRLC